MASDDLREALRTMAQSWIDRDPLHEWGSHSDHYRGRDVLDLLAAHPPAPLAQRERETAARAWDEGYRLGADLGLRIGERIVGTRDEWPAVQANPYRPDPTEGEESCS